MRKICVKLSLYLIYITSAIIYGATVASAAVVAHHPTKQGAHTAQSAEVRGVVVDEAGKPIPYATVYVDGSSNGTTTDAEGRYKLTIEAGASTIVALSLGYDSQSRTMELSGGSHTIDYMLSESATAIEGVEVSASGVGVVKRSPFNAVAIDTKELANGAKSLSDALTKAPGVKLRE
jgi:uncharacterized membrane protein